MMRMSSSAAAAAAAAAVVVVIVIQQTVTNTEIPVALRLSGWPEASSFPLHVKFME